MKKIMKVLTAVAFALSIFVVSPIKAEEPTFELIDFALEDKTELTLPYKMPVTLEYNTNISKDAWNIQLLFKSDSESNNIHYANYSTKNKTIVFDGNWRLNTSALTFLGASFQYYDTDTSENYNYLYTPYTKEELSDMTGDPMDWYDIVTNAELVQKKNYIINNPAIDMDVPEIVNLEFNQSNNTFVFDIYFDKVDLAGINSISFDFNQDDKGVNSISTLTTKIDEKHIRCTGKFKYFENNSGIYKLTSFWVSDAIGNMRYYSIYDDNWNSQWNNFELTINKNSILDNLEENVKVETALIPGYETGAYPDMAIQFPVLYVEIDGEKEYLNIENKDEVKEQLYKDIPIGKNSITTKSISYKVKISPDEYATLNKDTVVEYYDSPEGTVIMTKEVQEYSMRYEEAKTSGVFTEWLPYTVKLNDGTYITEYGQFGRGNGGAGIIGNELEGYSQAVGLMPVNVHRKFTFDEWNDYSKNYSTPVSFRIYFVDKDGNLVNLDGDILIPYEKRTDVSYQSETDGIALSSLQGTLPSTTIISGEETEVEAFKGDNYVAYDMTLKSNKVEVQPVEDVDVTVSLPDELKGKDVEVYYVDDEGKTELVEVTAVEKDKVTFTTDHFSTYSIVEKKDTPTTPTDPEDKPETKPEDKPNAPDTSDSTHTNTYVLLMLSMGMVGAFELKRKMNKH